MNRILLAAVSIGALSACRAQTSRDTPIFGIRNMYDQPKYETQEESNFFPDHRTMRPLVEGVVAHEEEVDPQIALGRLEDESGYVLEIPQPVIARMGGMPAVEERGQQRFGIYCAPCHDATGNGEGLVKRRAVAAGAAAFVPPTFHQDRIRHMPDGQLFSTITNGKNNMPPYAMQIPVDDRWAIVSYVRVLQLAQPKTIAPPGVMPTAVPGGTSMPAPGGPGSPMPSSAPAGSNATNQASNQPPTAPKGGNPTTAASGTPDGGSNLAPATKPTGGPGVQNGPTGQLFKEGGVIPAPRSVPAGSASGTQEKKP